MATDDGGRPLLLVKKPDGLFLAGPGCACAAGRANHLSIKFTALGIVLLIACAANGR